MQRNQLLTIFVLALSLFLGTDSSLHAGYDDFFTGSMRRFVLQDPPKPVPAVTFYNQNNQPVTLEAFKGHVVLLMMWATWCPYCRHDLPKVDLIAKEFAPKGLVVAAVAADKEGVPPVAAYFAANGVSLPLFVDPKGLVPEAFKARGFPHFVVIDRDGREIGQLAGETDWASEEARGFLKAVLSAAN